MTSRNRFTTSQICMLFTALVPVTKIVSMPSFLTMQADRSFWISAIICFALDLVLFAFMAFAIKKYECTFFDALKNTFGQIGAKIIIAIFALFFLLKALYPILEEKYFVENTFYEDITSSFIFYPFFALCFYLCFKGLKALKRTAFALLIFSSCGIVLTFLLTYKESEIARLLPLLQNSPKSVLGASFNNLLFCGEGMYLLFFMGKTDNSKRLVLPLTLSLSVGYIAVIALFISFYGVFGSVSMTKIFSLSQMSHYSLILSNVGRLDSIACFLIDFCRLFAISFPLMLCVECTRYIFGEKLKPTLIVSAIVIGVTLLFVLNQNQKIFYTFKTFNGWFKYVVFAFNFILPFSVFFLKKERK